MGETRKVKLRLRTRLVVAFLIITVIPLILIFAVVAGLGNYQMKAFRKAYDLTEQIDLLSSNSLQLFNRLTRSEQREISQILLSDPGQFQDPGYLETLNENLVSN